MAIPAVFTGMASILMSAMAADTVTWTPAEPGAAPATVKVSWIPRYVSYEIQDGIQIETVSTACTGLEVDFLEAAKGDTLVHNGVTYRITQVTPDSFGLVTILLRKVG